MSYTKQNFKSGQILTAAHLNHMEDGIAEAEKTGGSSITTSNSLTPEQFGAVGDGVTDDQKAMQTALDTAAENHVPLELKTGATYLCKEYLELPNDCTLHGNGAVILSELTYEKLGADRPFICITGESNTIWKHDIKIDELTIRATDNCQCNTMFRVMRARDISITNCLFDCDLNEQNRGCMDLYGAYEDILIQKVVFRQLTAGEAGGIWVRNWKSDVPCKNVRFLNCDFYKAGGDEVLGVWGWCGILKDVLISGCNFYDVDDEKYVSRGHHPVYGITLGQTGLRTDVRMENCFVRMNWCETLFRVTGDNTHTIVNNCDIYSDQPEGMGEHDPNSAACAMLAFGNGDKFHSVFSNNRIHFRGDRNRKICYKAGALRNNYFDVELGNGPAGCAEVVGNVFKGKFARQLFNDCGVIRDNIIEAEVIAPGLFSGAGVVENNQYTLTITGYNQGASVFGNNWGSGTIRNNKIEMNCTSTEPYGIRKYIFPLKNTIPEYIEGNIVTINGNVEYDSPHMASIFGGVVYRRNNYFNGIPERLFECTGVEFPSDAITEQYKKNTTLGVNILPEGCTDPIIYKWTDPDGVLEAEDGNYRPLKDGTASVTVTCGMFEATQTIKVELVPVACEGIRLSRTRALCGVGQTTYLKAFATPYWTTDDIVWASSAEDVVTVSQNGEVTALATGTANITVTCGSYSAVCKLSVVEANQLPAYTEGEWLLDNTVAYVPMPDMEEEHTLYASFDVDTSCVDIREEVILISSLLSGQQGQESIRLGFGADSTGYKTIRWMTTDTTDDNDGNTTCYKVNVANAGFKDGEPASSAFLYLKKGIANQGGSIIWNSMSSKVKPAPDSGYLTLNVQTDAVDKPVTNYSTGTALQAALTSDDIHATKATGFRLKELILFTNSSYETLADIKKYRENAEIDLRFDADGNPVNAGTAGSFVIAGTPNMGGKE